MTTQALLDRAAEFDKATPPGEWCDDGDMIGTRAKINGNVVCVAPDDRLGGSLALWPTNKRAIIEARSLVPELAAELKRLTEANSLTELLSTNPGTPRIVDLVSIIENFNPEPDEDEGDEPLDGRCAECRTPVVTDPELEATPFCNLCAQNLLPELARAIQELRLNRERLIVGLKRVTEWRDISTAPKDGTGIQAWCPGYGVRELFWAEADDRSGWLLVGAPMKSYEPTHWRELPKGPTT